MLVLRGLKILDDGVPEFHVDFEIEGFFESRLYKFFVGSHFVLFDAFDDPGEALYAQEVYNVCHVLNLFLADISHEMPGNVGV